jgi:hypothetical protein
MQFYIGLDREAEVYQSRFSKTVKHNVFGFNVSMDDLKLVAVVERLQQLFNNIC